MVGRPRKPTALKVLEGNLGKRRIVPDPPVEDGPCPPPDGLSAPARAVWARLAPELVAKGLLRPRFTDNFAVLCEAYVNWQKAAELVAMGGPVVMREGALISNPASREFARYAHLVRVFAADFGLTPAALAGRGEPEPPRDGRRDPARLLS